MRDPELVARAQHAAARLESAWERWRALQGLGETPAQPVVGYVGYALSEPWGQPRAVIGFSADEAERLAEFLERDNTDHVPLSWLNGMFLISRAAQLLAAASAAKDEVLAATSQLAGSQRCHSFLTGSGARLKEQEAELRSLCKNVWTRDGQAPARVQTFLFCSVPAGAVTTDTAAAAETAAAVLRGACADAVAGRVLARRVQRRELRPCSTCTATPRSGWCSGTPGSPWSSLPPSSSAAPSASPTAPRSASRRRRR